jgi:hypothetical protein
MSQLNKIYEKQYKKELVDTHIINLQTLIGQFRQQNETRREFVKNNNHRLQYSQVKTQYISIHTTQSRFELLLKIIEAQQKVIISLKEN